MPYVNIKLTPEGLSAEKKARLIQVVTDLLQEALDKDPETTIVVIDEVATDNWGIGGNTVTERRSHLTLLALLIRLLNNVGTNGFCIGRRQHFCKRSHALVEINAFEHDALKRRFRRAHRGMPKIR